MSDPDPAPASQRRPSRGAQMLGSLLVALVLVLVAGGLAVAALNTNAEWCIH